MKKKTVIKIEPCLTSRPEYAEIGVWLGWAFLTAVAVMLYYWVASWFS